MKKFNWWRFAAIFISVWYALSNLLMFVFGIYSLSLVSWLKNALIFIATYCGVFYDEMLLFPVFWIPIILGILGILGAVFQKERTKAERVCFAVIPGLGMLYSLSFMMPIQISGQWDVNFALIFAVIEIVWIAADIILSIAMSRKKQ